MAGDHARAATRDGIRHRIRLRLARVEPVHLGRERAGRPRRVRTSGCPYKVSPERAAVFEGLPDRVASMQLSFVERTRARAAPDRSADVPRVSSADARSPPCTARPQRDIRRIEASPEEMRPMLPTGRLAREDPGRRRPPHVRPRRKTVSHEFDARRTEWIAKRGARRADDPAHRRPLPRPRGGDLDPRPAAASTARPIALLKAHRFARQAGDVELDLADTHARARGAARDRPRPGVDRRRPSRLRLRRRRRRGRRTRARRLRARRARARPSRPRAQPEASGTDVVLYGFGRIGRLLARILIAHAGNGNGLRLRAIVVRKGSANDLVKRASLLRRDSVHGPFARHDRGRRGERTRSSPTARSSR